MVLKLHYEDGFFFFFFLVDMLLIPKQESKGMCLCRYAVRGHEGMRLCGYTDTWVRVYAVRG